MSAEEEALCSAARSDAHNSTQGTRYFFRRISRIPQFKRTAARMPPFLTNAHAEEKCTKRKRLHLCLELRGLDRRHGHGTAAHDQAREARGKDVIAFVW